jgi:ubiquinone/menaquinone biosynthesis C-methylase UbiE
MQKGDILKKMQNKLSEPIRNKLENLLENVGDMSLKRRARLIIENINPKDGEKILDLGCGTGYYLFLLSNLSLKLQLTGLDNDKRALEEAKASLSKSISYILSDSHKLPFKNNTFDKIIASEVLEHLRDDQKAIQEVYRILKPGGVFVISTPSINYPFFWDPINWLTQRILRTHIKSGFFSGIWYGHVRLYKKEELESKFIRAGFKILSSSELTYWCLPFNHYLVNLIARLLYDVKISSSVVESLSKFKHTKRPWFINLAFNFVNFIDKLNEIFPQINGVNVFISATKI